MEPLLVAWMAVKSMTNVATFLPKISRKKLAMLT
jgi:hypothetical protein